MPLTDASPRSRTARSIGTAVAALAVLAPLAMPAAAQHGTGAMGGGGGVGWFGLGPLLWIVVIGAIVALVGGYARPSANTEPRSGTDGALAALRERYARGELSDEEFERRRQRLQRDRQ